MRALNKSSLTVGSSLIYCLVHALTPAHCRHRAHHQPTAMPPFYQQLEDCRETERKERKEIGRETRDRYKQKKNR